jgi:FlaA1/EpsC-like NDP-sugar epimerase
MRYSSDSRPIYTASVIPSLEDLNWRRFLARPRLPSPPLAVFEALYRQPMLITGAGGSIGSALALRLGVLSPPMLLLLEASESHLYHLKRQWSAAGLACPMTPILGNASNPALIEHIFIAHGPRIVFHAAAYKHVPLMEEHPLAAIANNIFTTETLVAAASAHGARVVLLSTDKAVEPVSVMGATKRVAEQIVLAAGGTVLRLGNVLASRDSVVETFARQIAGGGPITVTDPAARRFFLTLDEAVNMLLIAAAIPRPSSLLAPVLPGPHFISDLAHFMVEELAPGQKIAIDFTEPRPGDKETELLWAPDDLTEPASLQPEPASLQPTYPTRNSSLESASESLDDALVSIQSATLPAARLQAGMAKLHAAYNARNLVSALVHLRSLAPDYTPSPAVLALSKQHGARVSL